MNHMNDLLSIQHWFCTRCTAVQNEIQVKMVSTSSPTLILNTNYLGRGSETKEKKDMYAFTN